MYAREFCQKILYVAFRRKLCMIWSFKREKIAFTLFGNTSFSCMLAYYSITLRSKVWSRFTLAALTAKIIA